MEDRIVVARGLVLYRRWRTWWLDLSRDGMRVRHSLKIHDQGDAIMVAGAIFKQLESDHVDVQEEIRLAKMALGLLQLEKRYGAGIREVAARAANRVVDRLGSLASSGSDLQSMIRNAVRSEVHGSVPEPVPVQKARTEYLRFQRAEGNSAEWIQNLKETAPRDSVSGNFLKLYPARRLNGCIEHHDLMRLHTKARTCSRGSEDRRCIYLDP